MSRVRRRAELLATVALSLFSCERSEGSVTSSSGPSPARTVVGSSAVTPAASVLPTPFQEHVREREQMVRLTIERRGVVDPRVLAAMRKVPRHAFVPASWVESAYEDRPLPIGSGQTISQPYIVAFMTEAAQPQPTSKCLEVGTGSGYQAAVLAEVCASVHSIEYLADVAAQGAENLRRTGYAPKRVSLRVGDGYAGWPSVAPFDVIVVTAAPEQVPRPLLDQLAVGGRLVVPVGPQHAAQELERWTRLRPGSAGDAFKRETLMGVRFVPFLGDGGS